MKCLSKNKSKKYICNLQSFYMIEKKKKRETAFAACVLIFNYNYPYFNALNPFFFHVSLFQFVQFEFNAFGWIQMFMIGPIALDDTGVRWHGYALAAENGLAPWRRIGQRKEWIAATAASRSEIG